MSLRQLIKYALSLPPRQAAGKGWRLARRLLAVRAWSDVESFWLFAKGYLRRFT